MSQSSTPQREQARTVSGISGLCMRVTVPAAHAFRRWGLDQPKPLLVVWALIRLVVFLVWGFLRPETQGDVIYYYQHIDFMFRTGPEQTMTEYPTPVLWLLALPYWLGATRPVGYVIAFVIMMLGLDIAFSLSLWCSGGTLRAQAVALWSVFVGFIGPTIYLRFDILTSVLAGWGLLSLMQRRSRTAGALAGAGAAIKLWPALLWPALCPGPAGQRLRATLGFWTTGVVLAVASWWWAGWDRLISPLTWQSGRGLQVESVWASLPMLIRALGLGDFAVTTSRFQAFEIYGPTVGWWTGASSVATLVGLGLVGYFFVRWWRVGRGRVLDAGAFVLLVTLVMIATNKTFSPQYMIWLGGPLAVEIALLGNEDRSIPRFWTDRARILALAVAILGTAVLTGIVFPIGYGPLVRDTPRTLWLRIPVTLVLVLRNLALLAMTGGMAKWIWGILRSPSPNGEGDPQ